MKRVEKVVYKLHNELYGKDILEVACGCAEFSISASKLAKTVHCIDLDDKRLLPNAKNCNNLIFCEMDATAMSYKNDSFDTIIIYNAIGHLQQVMEKTIGECLRVLRASGNMYIISSFKMDKEVILNNLLPLLEQNKLCFHILEDKIYICIQIKKQDYL